MNLMKESFDVTQFVKASEKINGSTETIRLGEFVVKILMKMNRVDSVEF